MHIAHQCKAAQAAFSFVPFPNVENYTFINKQRSKE